MPKKTPLQSKYTINAETGCWVWNKPLKGGYGLVRWKGRRLKAHRLVYELNKGDIPIGLDLDHLCRNPACVNPDHLEPVTKKENTRRGESTKINTEIARQIREAYAGEELASCLAIGSRFGVSAATVSMVINGIAWGDADGPITANRSKLGLASRKLSDSDVSDIRLRASIGNVKKSQLAQEYGVSSEQIRRIVNHVQR